jgi:hypothetical protein
MNGIGLSAQNLDVLLMNCKIISPLRSLLARTTIIYIVFRLRKRASSRDVIGSSPYEATAPWLAATSAAIR